MRFTVAAAILATSAMAQYENPDDVYSTAYTTNVVTVIDCPPEVTDCPNDQKTTSVETSVIPIETTSVIQSTRVHTVIDCPPEVTDCPADSTSVSTIIEVPTETPEVPTYGNTTVTYTKPGEAEETGGFTTVVTETPVPTEAPCESTSVTAITKSYTTVLTTVEYSTLVGACPTSAPHPSNEVTPPSPTNPVTPPPAEECNGYDCPPTGNVTTPPPSIPTAGAASFTGSAVFAVLAGVAAFAFA